MFDEGGGSGGTGVGGLLLLVGAVIFLKPRDLNAASRLAGRICGTTIYTLRGLRQVASNTIAKQGEGGEYSGMRDKVMSSFKQIEDITRTVSREVAETSPMAGLRAATTFKPKKKKMQLTPAAPTPAPTTDGTKVAPHTSESQTSTQTHTPGKLISVSPSSTLETGTMIVTRVIEESAFAQEQAKMLGGGATDEEEGQKESPRK